MLADFQPDVLKIDMALTRNIHLDRNRYLITRAVTELCSEMGISVVAEGVECIEEAVALRELGVRLFQGYLFAKPALEALPEVSAAVIDAVYIAHEIQILEQIIVPAAGGGREVKRMGV
jgi:EAL domain-containing protein (putative c-di-GMP-specific phosphodiesterase class I)